MWYRSLADEKMLNISIAEKYIVYKVDFLFFIPVYFLRIQNW